MRRRNKKVGVPSEIFARVSEQISQRLRDLNWDTLSQSKKSEYYTKWAADPEIGNLLTPYVNDPRLYLKDTIRRRQPDKVKEALELDQRIRDIVTSRQSIEIIDVEECRKAGTECRVWYRLPHNEFFIAVGGTAASWRKLLVLTLEWNYEISNRLGTYAPKRNPTLILFRSSGDRLGLNTEVALVKSLAQRCSIDLQIVSPQSRPMNGQAQPSQRRLLFGHDQGILKQEDLSSSVKDSPLFIDNDKA